MLGASASSDWRDSTPTRWTPPVHPPRHVSSHIEHGHLQTFATRSRPPVSPPPPEKNEVYKYICAQPVIYFIPDEVLPPPSHILRSQPPHDTSNKQNLSLRVNKPRLHVDGVAVGLASRAHFLDAVLRLDAGRVVFQLQVGATVVMRAAREATNPRQRQDIFPAHECQDVPVQVCRNLIIELPPEFEFWHPPGVLEFHAGYLRMKLERQHQDVPLFLHRVL